MYGHVPLLRAVGVTNSFVSCGPVGCHVFLLLLYHGRVMRIHALPVLGLGLVSGVTLYAEICWLFLSSAEMSFVIQHGVLKAAPGDVAGKMVQWCPDDGPAAPEALALWLQPDSPRVRILSLLLLAGTVPRSIVDAISKLCPSAELRSLKDIKQGLSEEQEQELVESAQKGPRKQSCLLNQLKSKYVMADAMSAVLRQQSGKQPLVEWSSSRNEKRKDVRAVWSLFYKDVLGDNDAQSDVEIDQHVGLAPAEHSTGTDERDKVLMLLDALHPITAMESDYLHALLADMYRDDVDVEVLTYPMIGLMALVRARVQAADDQEVAWWKQVFVTFSKKIRALRRAEDEAFRENEAKRQRVTNDPSDAAIGAVPVIKTVGLPANSADKQHVDVDALDQINKGATPARAVPSQAVMGQQSAAPQTTWEFGTGQGKVVIEKLSRDKERLRPIWVTGFEVADAMDAYGTFLAVFGSISLDYQTFKMMHKQFNEIITFVPGTALDNFMPTDLRTENMRITAARDPQGRSDHVTVKELPLLDALRKIGSMVPSTSTVKKRDHAFPMSGVLSQCPPTLSLSVVPPFSIRECFVSLWGPGYQRELQGPIRFYPGDPDAVESLQQLVDRHAIWMVVPRGDKTASTRSQENPGDAEMEWSLAGEEVEVAIHNLVYQWGDNRQVPDDGWVKSTAWKIKRKRRRQCKTGGYVLVSALESSPPGDWGRLGSVAGAAPEWQSSSWYSRQRVLWCGTKHTTVEPALGPQFTGLGSSLERIGRRVVEMYTAGPAALSADSATIRSGVFHCGNTFFHFEFHPSVLADVGILRWPVEEDTPVEEVVIPMSVALSMALWWGFSGQVLRYPNGLISRRRHCSSPQFSSWWGELCDVLGIDHRSRPYEAELVKLRVSMVGGKKVLSMHLNWHPTRWEILFYEHAAWQHVRISEFRKLDPIQLSFLSANIQGLHRTKEGPISKWDELLDAMAIGAVSVLLVQEAWPSSRKPGKRSIEGFWSSISQHLLRGQGNEIWVRSQWCKFQMVLLDEPYALLLLVSNAMGAGILGSVHMAQRKAQTEFQQQVVHISSCLEKVPYQWAVIGGDWNRDIRTDKYMQVVLYKLHMFVAPMENTVDLPKDFLVVHGIQGPLRTFWLKKVGDHPLVWLQGSHSISGVRTGALTRPVAPVPWPGPVKTVFSDVMEAFSQGCSDLGTWLHLYRDVVSLGNQIVENDKHGVQSDSGQADFREVLRDMQLVVTGQGWRQADRRLQRQSEAYWQLMLRNWKAVSGTGLQGNTLRLLKLKKSSPYKIVHTVLDNSTGQLVSGLDVLAVAPRECGNKYIPRPIDMPEGWLSTLDLRAAEWQPSHGMGLRYYAAWLERRGVLPCLEHLLGDWHKLNNKTPSVDGMVLALVKHFGLYSLQQLLRLLRTPLRDGPPETRQALHLVLHKKDGFNLNTDSRPIKLLSALFRLLAKLLCPHLQHALRAPVSGGRQFAGYG